ncbi:MAG: tyrosine-type recombinase/integrase [Candidatus Terrybacteria bacterium]|nr:tyrosine-type recombinase/integrase [Candidatus Terrybacteria bacterium]
MGARVGQGLQGTPRAVRAEGWGSLGALPRGPDHPLPGRQRRRLPQPPRRADHSWRLRPAAGGRRVAGGASIRVIQEMLGHSNLSTTIQRYAHVSPEFLRRACEKAHPRF